jgi:hypothetical protein
MIEGTDVALPAGASELARIRTSTQSRLVSNVITR